LQSSSALPTRNTVTLDAFMTTTFDGLTSRARDWSLDDVGTEVNRLLPEVVPSEAATRAELAVNARLVRRYTTEAVLPKPLEEGADARSSRSSVRAPVRTPSV